MGNAKFPQSTYTDTIIFKLFLYFVALNVIIIEKFITERGNTKRIAMSYLVKQGGWFNW